MNARPILFDAFCGAGCAARGYHDAGFDVFGVDINEQSNYPYTFHQADALAVLEDILSGEWPTPAAIHASCPCQHFTKYGNSVKDIQDRYEDFLEPTRVLLDQIGVPYVIENVERAPLLDPIRLCGSMFEGNGTHDLRRHRLFETNWPLENHLTCDHSIWAPNRYPGGGWKRKKHLGFTPSSPIRNTIEIGRWNIPLETQKWAMGVDWNVTVRELSEGVPPSYTEFVGKQLLEQIA